ncbi:MAG: cytochrome c oxidase subunit 3 [Nitrospirota bacterium]
MDAKLVKHTDEVGAKMGMWLFLFTEMLFFGGVFLLYAVYRAHYSADFHDASSELNRTIGTFNTVILITSSFSAALSLSEIKKGAVRSSGVSLGITALLGTVFLIVKYFEWSTKIGHGIYPGSAYLNDMSHGKVLFYSLYFVMTGIHAFHVLIGIIVFLVIIFMINKGTIHEGSSVKLENAALYWHFVDIAWIYLFPLLYLLR